MISPRVACVMACMCAATHPLASAPASANQGEESFACPFQSRHLEIWDRLENDGGFRSQLRKNVVVQHLPSNCNAWVEPPQPALVASAFFQANVSAPGRLALIPYPAQVKFIEGSSKPFVLSRDAVVIPGSGVPEDDISVRSLRERLDEVVGLGSRGDKATSSIALDLEPVDGADPESYKIVVESGRVSVSAPALAGLFYGSQSLRQMIPDAVGTQPRISSQMRGAAILQTDADDATGTVQLPALVIEDSPAFKWRGLHLDVSRHFFSAENVMKLIDTMAAFKMNKFHWHLTDDQGWRLPVPDYPELTKKGAGPRFEGTSLMDQGDGIEGAYTADEIRQVVDHAKERHIDVIPEIDVPGHVAAAIAAYPELGNEDFDAPSGPQSEWGVHPWTLAPTEESVKFLEAVFGTVADLFPFKYVHIGGDEARQDQWRGASEEAKSKWLPFEGSNAQSFFNKKISDILRAKGKLLAGWDEVQSMDGLPDDATIFAWRGDNELMKAIRNNRPVVNANLNSLYFDRSQGPGEPKAQPGQISLAQVYSYEPSPRMVQQESQHLVLGAQGQLWSEYIPTWSHLEYMAFPRTLALAERLWTPSSEITGFDEFSGRLQTRVRDLQRRSINFRKI